jgi:general stress protein 26
MLDHETKNQCIDLMETADVIIFGTIDADGFPETRAMANLRNSTQFPALADLFKTHNDDFLIYLASDGQSHKFKQAAANPKTSVYFCNAQTPGGLMLCGTAETVTDAKLKQQLWQEDWTMYFPAGLKDPEYNILKFTPALARCWFAGMKNPAEWTF